MEPSEVPVTSSSYEGGGLFTASRSKPFPSTFPPHSTAVTYDVVYVGILVAFLVILISFCAVFPSVIGLKEKMKVLMRVLCSLTLGVVIMACNFGQEWEVGVIRTGTPYRAGTGQEIKAQIGIHLGLRSLNITLKALEEPHGDLTGERIDYNERFSWTWGQGSPGFGPTAGSFQRAFRHAQEAGLPLPILWVAEYFILDGEGIRFGRHYRYSGWYAHICVWTAFPLYLLTIILFKMVIRMAAQTLILTGTLLTSASLIWAFNRNHKELQIPFEDGMLTTKFGIHWYLSLVMGTLCITLGLAIYLYDLKYPGNLSWVFGNDPLSIVEQVTTEEEGKGEEGEEKVALPDQTPTAQKKRMKMAGRRVVTTLKVFGTKHCLKKMTHTSSENWHLLTRSLSGETKYVIPEGETSGESLKELHLHSAEYPPSCPFTQTKVEDPESSPTHRQTQANIDMDYEDSDENTFLLQQDR